MPNPDPIQQLLAAAVLHGFELDPALDTPTLRRTWITPKGRQSIISFQIDPKHPYSSITVGVPGAGSTTFTPDPMSMRMFSLLLDTYSILAKAKISVSWAKGYLGFKCTGAFYDLPCLMVHPNGLRLNRWHLSRPATLATFTADTPAEEVANAFIRVYRDTAPRIIPNLKELVSLWNVHHSSRAGFTLSRTSYTITATHKDHRSNPVRLTIRAGQFDLSMERMPDTLLAGVQEIISFLRQPLDRGLGVPKQETDLDTSLDLV